MSDIKIEIYTSAIRDDVAESLRKTIEGFDKIEKKLDDRFGALEKALDSKIEAIDAKIDMLPAMLEVIDAKIAALDEKIEALGQAKTAPVREEVPEVPGLGAFGHLPVLEQHRMQQRGGDY
jgi:hypothetical protein